jgi:hypothetical protein
MNRSCYDENVIETERLQSTCVTMRGAYCPTAEPVPAKSVVVYPHKVTAKMDKRGVTTAKPPVAFTRWVFRGTPSIVRDQLRSSASGGDTVVVDLGESRPPQRETEPRGFYGAIRPYPCLCCEDGRDSGTRVCGRVFQCYACTQGVTPDSVRVLVWTDTSGRSQMLCCLDCIGEMADRR